MVLIVTSAVYPRLVVDYDFSYFPYKRGPVQLRILKPTKNLKTKLRKIPGFPN